jgi:histone H3/H4
MIIKDQNFLKAVLEDEKSRLTQDQISVLLPEIEYKTLTLLKEAKKLMKHSKRRYLKGQDIDLALKKMETGSMSAAFGSVPYEYAPEIKDGEEHMVLVNKEVPIINSIEKGQIKETPLDTKLEFYWC